MAFPKVTVIKTNGNLGRPEPVEDGICALVVSGIAVADQFALGDVLGPFYQLSDAENKGINAAYDTANTVLAWQHIRDFYSMAGNGVELYVMVVAKTLTMEDMCDKTLTHAAKLLEGANGRIRLLGITRIPNAQPVADSGFDPDVFLAVANAQELSVDVFDKYRPVQILIEGRQFGGTASVVKDMRNASTGCNANKVSVVISQDTEVSALNAAFLTYAHVGFALGREASIGPQRNIGRVKDGAMPVDIPGLSNGAAISTFSETDLAVLNDKGYIFLKTHSGKAGYYFNDDHTACVITDDYAYINRGRIIDKAARLIRQVYLDELLDDFEVDSVTGRIAAEVVKGYQAEGEKKIQLNMTARQEISGATVFIDPDQDVLATDKIETRLSIVPRGMSREITVLLGFDNPAQ